MRNLLPSLALGVVLIWAPASLTAASHEDLSGVWRLDTANSVVVSGRAVVSGTLMVAYRQKAIDTSETLNFADGERTLQRNWKVDNRYHPVLGDGSGQVLAKWEGRTLVADHEDGGRHEIFRLTLSPDDRSLTETVLRPDGSSSTFVWRR
jgi:hypothetical protein